MKLCCAIGAFWLALGSAQVSALSADRVTLMKSLWSDLNRSVGSLRFDFRLDQDMNEIWRCQSCDAGQDPEVAISLIDRQVRFASRTNSEISFLIQSACEAPLCETETLSVSGLIGIKHTEFTFYAVFVEWTVLFENDVLWVAYSALPEAGTLMTESLANEFLEPIADIEREIIAPFARTAP